MSINFLKEKNPHPYDSRIEFDEEPHIYTIDGEKGYTSVTTWIHQHFNEFNSDETISKMMKGKNWKNSKYFGMNPDEIKNLWDKSRIEASSAGTKLHHDIECYYNNIKVSNDSIEYTYFINFLEDHSTLIPYRTEWMIFDVTLKLAGSIDAIFENKDKTIDIYDWKRSKKIKKNNKWSHAKTECIQHIEDCNFWHYSIQLNTYRKLLEKNYNKKINKMYIICFHPNNENNSYIKYEIPDLSNEINNLFQLRMCQINNSFEFKLPRLIQLFIKNKSEINKLFEKHNDLIEQIKDIDPNFEEDIELEVKIYNNKYYNVDTFNNYIYNDNGELIGVWDNIPKLFI